MYAEGGARRPSGNLARPNEIRWVRPTSLWPPWGVLTLGRRTPRSRHARGRHELPEDDPQRERARVAARRRGRAPGRVEGAELPPGDLPWEPQDAPHPPDSGRDEAAPRVHRVLRQPLPLPQRARHP